MTIYDDNDDIIESGDALQISSYRCICHHCLSQKKRGNAMKVSMHLGKKYSIRHNIRDFDHSKWNTDGHIDQSRSRKNVVLRNIPLIELFKEEFEQAIVDFDSKQRHTNRRIGSYKYYYAEQKNNAQEMILQVGNEREQLTEEQYREFFHRAYEQFRLQNPTLKVFHASIHFDETTPHMHLDFIPVAESNRGLTKKVSMEGALKPLGFERIKGEKYSETPYKRWLANRRRTYEALAGEYTKIEPSDIAAEKHQEPQEYKAKIKQEIEMNGLIATLKSNNPIAISQAAHKLVSNAEKVMEMYAERGRKL